MERKEDEFNKHLERRKVFLKSRELSVKKEEREKRQSLENEITNRKQKLNLEIENMKMEEQKNLDLLKRKESDLNVEKKNLLPQLRSKKM